MYPFFYLKNARSASCALCPAGCGSRHEVRPIVDPFRPHRPALARGRHPLMSASPSGLPDGEGATLSGDANYAPRDVDYYAPSPESRRPHAPHPDCPDTLACLPDSEGRPQHTLPVILRCAILGSPHKRLTIREIYSAMEVKYPWYRTAGPTWKVRP